MIMMGKSICQICVNMAIFSDTVSIKKLMVALVLVVVDPSPVFHSTKSSAGMYIRSFEPFHEKAGILHVRKQRCTFVLATWIVQSIFCLNPKFQASSFFPRLYRLVCVKPGQNSHRQFFLCWG